MVEILIMHKKPSRFLTIKCEACQNEQIVFSHAKTTVNCFVCKEVLVQPGGGKAFIKGSVVNTLS